MVLGALRHMQGLLPLHKAAPAPAQVRMRWDHSLAQRRMAAQVLQPALPSKVEECSTTSSRPCPTRLTDFNVFNSFNVSVCGPQLALQIRQENR